MGVGGCGFTHRPYRWPGRRPCSPPRPPRTSCECACGKVTDGRVCQEYSSQPRRVHCAVVRPVDRIVCTVLFDRSGSIDRVGQSNRRLCAVGAPLVEDERVVEGLHDGVRGAREAPAPQLLGGRGAGALFGLQSIRQVTVCPGLSTCTHTHSARGVRTILNVAMARSRTRSRRQEPERGRRLRRGRQRASLCGDDCVDGGGRSICLPNSVVAALMHHPLLLERSSLNTRLRLRAPSSESTLIPARTTTRAADCLTWRVASYA